MSRIRGRDTQPEMIVRRIAHGLGFRFRLHRRDLPGSPDLVFPQAQGRDHGPWVFLAPASRLQTCLPPEDASAVLGGEVRGQCGRDRRNEEALHELGWRVMVIWECETRDREAVAERIDSFLRGGRGEVVEKGGGLILMP